MIILCKLNYEHNNLGEVELKNEQECLSIWFVPLFALL